MKRKELDEALGHLARSTPRPILPPSFERNVWRAIRERSDPGREPAILEALWAWIFRPSGALSVAIVTLAVEVGMGSLDIARATPQRAWGMTVFAPDAPSLPSTLLGHSR